MIARDVLDRFVETTAGQARREGVRYATEGWVQSFTGRGRLVRTLVTGTGGDYDVLLWEDDGELAHHCTCPSWRSPCKHVVAAAITLREDLSRASEPRGSRAKPKPQEDPAKARSEAIEERKKTALREPLEVHVASGPKLDVCSPSGFRYTVTLRGGPEGPHGCNCPDFEANRLHTCKHVERARLWLEEPGRRHSKKRKAEIESPRVYLHCGEAVEPRLFGTPKGRGAPRVRAAFDERGVLAKPLAGDEAAILRFLETLGSFVEDEALAWLRTRLDQRPRWKSRNLLKPKIRPGLAPFGFQWEGAEFLARRGRALLADEMGLGKTVQAILAATMLRYAASPVRSVTIVCPASLRGGWEAEIKRWIGEEATLLAGRPTERAEVISERPRWLVTHYEQVLRDHDVHAGNPPDLLILDEAQRAKGIRTRTARVLKSIGARFVFALTGTPLENRLEEAYAIAQLIDQRLLPPLWQIERDHFVRDENGRRVVLYRELDTLRSQLAPAFLRRRKEDVALQLPERLSTTAKLPMHPAAVPTYNETMHQVAIIASKKVLLPRDLERMQRLLVIARRCCNGPHLLGLETDERKVPKLLELEQALRELCLGEGRKVVVFSEWTDMTDSVEALCNRLGIPAHHLSGRVPVRRRKALIESFTSTPEPAVFISTDAGGVGLNLQAADAVVNLDLPWNPAKLEQRIARIHRIGSKRAVQVLLLITEDSVEERILALHATKRNVLENIWAKDGDDVIEAPGGSGAFKEMVDQILGRSACPIESGSDRLPTAESTAGSDDIRETERGSESPSVDAAAHQSVSVQPEAIAAAVAAVAESLPADHRRSLAVVFRSLAEALER